jgi:RNA polymerase sigma factor (sigma-70 family)
MSRNWDLNTDALKALLSWLDPDLEQAGQKYETIRAGLVKMLIRRNCSAAEDIADDVINRVAIKVPEMRDSFKGDPAKYFYGVARNVVREYQRRALREEPFDEQLHDNLLHEPTDELASECMNSCMKQLSRDNHELVRRYYEEFTSEQRERLAKSLGTTKNALAVRVSRVRVFLKNCYFNCMQEKNRVK